jgi:hypothetical protein
MNTIEEKLWNYIDGSCTAEEEQAISTLVATDELYARKYQELLQLNTGFNAIELEEPSMAFTYKVMETIRTEAAQKPLKAGVNKYIIWGIGVFFTLTIVALLIAALSSVKSAPDNTTGLLNTNLALPSIKNYLNRPVINAFIGFDIILALFLLDAFLRKRLGSYGG